MNATGELLISTSSWSKMLNFWHPYSGKVLLQMPSSLVFEWQSQQGGLVGESLYAAADVTAYRLPSHRHARQHSGAKDPCMTKRLDGEACSVLACRLGRW